MPRFSHYYLNLIVRNPLVSVQTCKRREWHRQGSPQVGHTRPCEKHSATSLFSEALGDNIVFKAFSDYIVFRSIRRLHCFQKHSTIALFSKAFSDCIVFKSIRRLCRWVRNVLHSTPIKLLLDYISFFPHSKAFASVAKTVPGATRNPNCLDVLFWLSSPL